MRKALGLLVLMFPVALAAQPYVQGNPRYELSESNRARILRMFEGLDAGDLPHTIVVLDHRDFDAMRMKAASIKILRAASLGHLARGLAFTHLGARRTFLLRDVLGAPDSELETVLIHEVMHLRRERENRSHDEILVIEDTAKFIAHRRKSEPSESP